jgi:limonene-1,2-epoxide hydrolase
MLSPDWWTRLFAAIDGKNTPGFLGFLTDDAEFRFANLPGAHGHSAIAAAVDAFFASIAGSRHRMLRNWQDASSAVCQGEVEYTRLDGGRVTLPFVNVFEMQGERVRRYLIYIDAGPLYAAA